MNPTVEQIRRAGASPYAIKYYEKHGCDPAALLPDHPEWIWWLSLKCPGDWLTPAMVATCRESGLDIRL